MRVLFVCVHNSGRSQMAEAYVNHLARANGIDATAESAGIAMGRELNPAAVAAMLEDGVSMTGQTPKLLTSAMIAWADKIISMGCGVDAAACPANFILTEDWGLDDPAGQPIETVRAIRAAIKERSLTLLGLPQPL